MRPRGIVAAIMPTSLSAAHVAALADAHSLARSAALASDQQRVLLALEWAGAILSSQDSTNPPPPPPGLKP